MQKWDTDPLTKDTDNDGTDDADELVVAVAVGPHMTVITTKGALWSLGSYGSSPNGLADDSRTYESVHAGTTRLWAHR